MRQRLTPHHTTPTTPHTKTHSTDLGCTIKEHIDAKGWVIEEKVCRSSAARVWRMKSFLCICALCGLRVRVRVRVSKATEKEGLGGWHGDNDEGT